MNRTSSFVNELTNGEIKITDSYIANQLIEFSKKLSNVSKQLQNDVKQTDVIHLDETCMKLKGKQVTIQGYATQTTTYLTPSLTKCNTNIGIFLQDYHE
jgi:transposase-like protein